MRWLTLFLIATVLRNSKVEGKDFNLGKLMESLDAIDNELTELSGSLKELADATDNATSITDEIELTNEKSELPGVHEVDVLGPPETNETSSEPGERDMEDLDDATDNATSITDEIELTNENSELPGVHEVDVLGPPETSETSNEPGNGKRNAVRNPNLLWRSRDIGYVLDKSLSRPGARIIPIAMEFLSNVSCIKFHRKRSTDKQWIKFFKGGGCYSSIGRRMWRTPQPISIGRGCAHKGVVMHEILHALGFYHEQSRYDRDQYIEIKWENIVRGMEHNFKKLTPKLSRNLNSGYDYDSIMHYGKRGFTKNGRDVIMVIGHPKAKIGQRGTLSKEDVISLNRLYHCTNKNSLGETVWTEWSDFGICHLMTSNSNDPCYKRRYRFCDGDKCTCGRKSTGEQLCTMDKEVCTDAECTFDGHWGHWSSWTSCSAGGRCQKGRKRSARSCTNPSPSKGGKQCIGSSTKETDCASICPRQCTFNDNMCGYTVAGRWIRKDGRTPSCRTGPSHDADGDGMYIYTEVSGAKQNTVSRLQSPMFKATSGPECFSMQYHMYGTDMGKLTAYQTDGTINTTIWEMSGNQGNRWKKAEFNVDSTVPFRITFVAISGKSYRGDSALDNLFLDNKPCGNITPPSRSTITIVRSTLGTVGLVTTPPAPVTTGRCTFNKGTCGYIVDGRWRRRSGKTPSYGTGPSGDVDGNGMYMYTEVSGIKPGTISRMQSPIFKATAGPECFSLRYHMYGKDMGKVIAYMTVGTINTTKWEMSGNQGNRWKKAEFNVDSAVPFVITFVAISGKSYRGDSALDNLFLDDKPCGTVAPVTAQCTFTKGTCGYTVGGRWRRRGGKTPSYGTGPSGDVDGNGMYMYTEVSGIKPGTISRMRSPIFKATTGPKCFSLRYHMYGKDMGKLIAYQTVGTVNSTKWEMSGNQGNRWKKAEFNVDSPVPFRISFVATSGKSYRGDSALDNLLLDDKPCGKKSRRP